MYYQISKVFGHLGAKTRPKHGLAASWRQGVRILKKLGSTAETFGHVGTWAQCSMIQEKKSIPCRGEQRKNRSTVT